MFFTVPLHVTTVNVCNCIQNHFTTFVVFLNKRKFVRKCLTHNKMVKHKHINKEKLIHILKNKEKNIKSAGDAYSIYKNIKLNTTQKDRGGLTKSSVLFISKRSLKILPPNKSGNFKSKPSNSNIEDSYTNKYPKTCFCGIPAPYGILSKFLAYPGNFQWKMCAGVQNHFHTTASNSTCEQNTRKDVCGKKNGKDNLTAVLYGINDLKLEQRPIPSPKDDQVLLQMEVVGICGSDVHYLVDGRIGPFVVEKPMVIGHEASGTVVKLGKSVKNLKEGDRVAVEPGVGCRKCHYCRTGRYNLCPDMVFCATPPVDGNLARFYVHAAEFCFKLPKHISLEEGALLEPLSCSVRACKRGKVTIGSTVLILGAGPIGLTSLLAAKAFGASRIVITDLFEYRLQLAKKLGADCTIQVCPHYKEGDIIQQIKEAFNCDEPTVSIECSGTEICIRIAIQVTKAGGSAVLIGIGKSEPNLPANNVIFKEVDIKGVCRYVNDYPTSLEMVSTCKINLLPLVTHEYKLEDTLKAFETAKTGKGNPIKILIHANPKWQGTC